MTKKITIHIDWDGPFTEREVENLTNDADYGVYQLYGRHPVYGMSPRTLLYIGKASDNTFGHRMRNHSLKRFVGKTEQVFVGRFAGEQQPGNAEWGNLIAEAEQLLIYAHAPSWNSQCINDYGNIRNIHILNWGNYVQLLPEVSRDRYYQDHNNLPDGYKIFSE